MIEIKSLTRITEEKSPHDIQHEKDIEKANQDYDKAAGPPGLLGIRTKYSLNPFNMKRAHAAADRDAAFDAADLRRKAAKQGMVSKQDVDEIKFNAAKTHAASAIKAKQDTGSGAEVDKSGILHKIGEHPYLVASVAAGIAGLAALQKRKKRLTEPGSYN